MNFSLDREQLERFREMYYFEHEERNKIDISMSIRTALFGILIGVFSYVTFNLPDYSCSVVSMVFYILYLLTYLPIILTIIYIFKTLNSRKYLYAYLPEPEKIKQYFDDLRSHYGDEFYEKESLEDLLREDYYEFYIRRFSEDATVNTIINTLKKSYRARATYALLSSWIILFCSLFLFVLIKIN